MALPLADNVDIFFIGEDWKGKIDFLKEYCEVICLQRTEGISSTEIKKLLKSLASLSELVRLLPTLPKEEIIKAFEIIEQIKLNLE